MNTNKTWKIGEYAQGGVITVEINKTDIAVIGKEWDFSKGSRKSSDQSNAKEFRRDTVSISDSQAHRKLNDVLCDLTTSFYADEIVKWIESKVSLNKSFPW